MRRLPVLAVAIALSALSVPAAAQDAGPVAPIEGQAVQLPSTSVFPLWKSLLDGREFLPPYGVNVVMFDLNGHWDVENFSVAVGGQEKVSVSGTANVHPFTYGGRADVWVLPFLNVFVTAGGVKLDVQAIGEDLPLGVSGLPPEPVRGDVLIDLDFTGTYYGVGGVVSGAWKGLFASVDGSAVWTNLTAKGSDAEGSGLETYTASVRVGATVKNVQPYIGARYVKKIDHFEGTVTGPGGRPVTFAVDLRAPEWNYQAGVHALIAKRWEIVVEAGFGDRTHGLLNLGYRF